MLPSSADVFPSILLFKCKPGSCFFSTCRPHLEKQSEHLWRRDEDFPALTVSTGLGTTFWTPRAPWLESVYNLIFHLLCFPICC